MPTVCSDLAKAGQCPPGRAWPLGLLLSCLEPGAPTGRALPVSRDRGRGQLPQAHRTVQSLSSRGGQAEFGVSLTGDIPVGWIFFVSPCPRPCQASASQLSPSDPCPQRGDRLQHPLCIFVFPSAPHGRWHPRPGVSHCWGSSRTEELGTQNRGFSLPESHPGLGQSTGSCSQSLCPPQSPRTCPQQSSASSGGSLAPKSPSVALSPASSESRVGRGPRRLRANPAGPFLPVTIPQIPALPPVHTVVGRSWPFTLGPKKSPIIRQRSSGLHIS